MLVLQILLSLYCKLPKFQFAVSRVNASFLSWFEWRWYLPGMIRVVVLFLQVSVEIHLNFKMCTELQEEQWVRTVYCINIWFWKFLGCIICYSMCISQTYFAVVYLKSYARRFIQSFWAFQIKSYDLLNESNVAFQATTSAGVCLLKCFTYMNDRTANTMRINFFSKD